jgi:hypothetical protein
LEDEDAAGGTLTGAGFWQADKLATTARAANIVA